MFLVEGPKENNILTKVDCKPRLELGESQKISIVFDSFGKFMNSFDGITYSFYIKNANVNVPNPPKNFFSLFSQRMIE